MVGQCIIIGGEPGAGKTYNCLSYIFSKQQEQEKSKAFVIDTENKVTITKNKHFRDLKDVEIRECAKFGESFDTDAKATLKAIREAKDEVIKDQHQYSVIVLDSIVELRVPLCYDEWKLENNRKSAINPGDWATINDKVRGILKPLCNISRESGSTTDVIITAPIGNRYEDHSRTGTGIAVGKEIKIRPWMEFYTTHVVELYKVREYPEWKYTVEFTKSPAGCFSEDNLFMRPIYPLIHKEVE